MGKIRVTMATSMNDDAYLKSLHLEKLDYETKAKCNPKRSELFLMLAEQTQMEIDDIIGKRIENKKRKFDG